MSSCLSSLPDGCGFYYGFVPGDFRQINVRHEIGQHTDPAKPWVAYVHGEPLSATFATKELAEVAAVAWLTENADV